MYKCEICKRTQKEGTKLNKIVTRIRNVNYPPVKQKDGKIKYPSGHETVKELNACPICASEQYPVAVVEEKTIAGELCTI